MNLTIDEHHVYRLGDKELPSVTGILKDAGLIDDTWFTEFARDRGSKAHMAIRFALEGDLDRETLDPEIGGYVEAAEKAIKELGIEPLAIEEPVHSIVYGYAGTPDLIGKGKDWPLVMIDWKTGLIDEVTGLQLAAYASAINETTGMPYDRFGVKLNQDGTFKIYPFTDSGDRDVFLAALAVRNWRKNNGT